MARLDVGDQLQRLGHAQVGRVRLPAQRVDDDHVQIVQQRARRRRDAAGVGQIGEVADAVAGGADRAVPHRDRLNARLADIERRARRRPCSRCAGSARSTACPQRRSAKRSRSEAPVGASPKHGRMPPSAALNAFRSSMPGRVVGVKMGVQDGVDAGDAFAQGLQAQLGPRVDQQPHALVGLDVHRGARALVARVGAGAGRTAAADDGHAVRGRGPEETDPHLRMTIA